MHCMHKETNYVNTTSSFIIVNKQYRVNIISSAGRFNCVVRYGVRPTDATATATVREKRANSAHLTKFVRVRRSLYT